MASHFRESAQLLVLPGHKVVQAPPVGSCGSFRMVSRCGGVGPGDFGWFFFVEPGATVKVSLVRPEHREYREWCRRQRLRSGGDHLRDPIAQEYYAQLMCWEKVVQRLLEESVSESASERILMYERLQRVRRRTAFLELDFVSGSSLEPQLFVEIKLRERTAGVSTGWAQLRRSLTAARTRWPGLRGVCVCVSMGGVLKTEAAPGVSTLRAEDLRGRLESVAGVDGEVLWLEGREVADFGVCAKLFREEDVQQLPELRLDMLQPLRVLERLRQREPV